MKDLSKSLITGGPIEPLFSLGEMYVSDFLALNEEPRGKKIELALGFDPDTSLVQLTKVPDSSEMWGDRYWYKSGTNQFMKDALRNVVEETLKFKKGLLTWTDCASNDNTLLSFVPNKNIRIGVDPSAYEEGKEHADLIIKDYFSKEIYFKNTEYKSDVVTCCAMFYDLTEPVKFVKDVESILKDDGIFVLQLSYTPLMLIQGEIGNILSEHCAYYTLKSLENVLIRGGFKVIDAELNNVNGGSIRVYCIKNHRKNTFKTQADRDVAGIRLSSLRAWEEASGANTKQAYLDFYNRMNDDRSNFLSFLKEEKSKGKTFAGYGASSKGNTVLQWYGLGQEEIDFIAERQERKFGLRTVGSNIPIISEKEAREIMPDYMIVFPWHFISEFVEREQEYLKNGGKFIVLSPKFEIIGA